MKRLVVGLVIVVAAAGAAWAAFGRGGDGEGPGVRVDAGELDDACFDSDPPRCTGAHVPWAAVSAERRRILVVWTASYRPVDAVYARELDADGTPLDEPRELGEYRDFDVPLVARATPDGWEIAWDRRVHRYTEDLRPLGTRRGALPDRRDPYVRPSRNGLPLATVPGGVPVYLHLTTDRTIRAIPQER